LEGGYHVAPADVPVFARFVLPVATTEDEFDAEGYIKMGER
jgi:hypothetical protein